MDLQPERSRGGGGGGGPDLRRAVLGSPLCSHCSEILRHFPSTGPVFSFCTGPRPPGSSFGRVTAADCKGPVGLTDVVTPAATDLEDQA